MRNVTTCSLGLAISIGLLAGAAGATLVTIGESTRYQTITGFGSYGAKRPWWSGNNPSTYYDAAFLNTLVSDMAETVLRERITPSFAPNAFTAHPVGQINYSVFSTTYLSNEDDEQPFGVKFPYWRTLKQRADAVGEPLTFILSIWSPPAWMKDNGSALNGGHVKPENYDEFGEMVAAAVKMIKDSTGIDVYAVSLQNEPLFVESYNSCVYTAVTYRDCARAVGGRLRAEGLSAKLFGAEAMVSDFMNTRGFTAAILSDATAASVRDRMAFVAVHGYGSDGTTPDSPSPRAWTQPYNYAHSYGLGLWMTETSGFSTDWSGAFDVLKGIHVALRCGCLSGWVFWVKDWTTYGSSGVPNKVGHAIWFTHEGGGS